ncbi:MAG: ABC transporter substrate-binding protein [Chromatiales bacterium]
MRARLAAYLIPLAFAAASTLDAAAAPWNNPYPAADTWKNIYYDSFEERPKHLDPALSYSENEAEFIAQIYEPPLQYHFLRRPYELVPLTVIEVPEPLYLDAAGNALPPGAPPEAVAHSVYRFRLRPGIRYQPHPAFATGSGGRHLYHNLDDAGFDGIHALKDFTALGSRELEAADYVYQIKRLAHPALQSPIAGLMSEYIVGLQEIAAMLKKAYETGGYPQSKAFFDLRDHELEGAHVVDRYTWEIKINGKYPQFLYWQAMPFFAPMPWEADRFHSQPGMAERNITLDWFPVGTGPFMLTENNPNRRMVLQRNPNFRGERYPQDGEMEDGPAGLLADAGRTMPFVDAAIYSLETESIPRWNKFLQGYYDTSGIGNDNFDQAIQFSGRGEMTLTEEMEAKGVRLLTAVSASTSYTGFNMLDPVVGGLSEEKRKLRRALAIAVDIEEYIAIFTNDRGIAAQGPIPPGLFGYREREPGINHYVYDWAGDKPRRKSIEEAKRLLVEAGYPEGRDARTGAPLVLYLDTAATGPEAKALLDWWRKQFAKLNVQLVVRDTDYNRFQEKMLKGNAQIFQWGWNADYPDPENFMFLLYGRNAKARHQGENAANYENPAFDRLFEKMKNMENSPERQRIIDEMTEIVCRDGPWLWGVHPKGFSLLHAWYHNAKPNLMARNTLKYKRVDPPLRAGKRAEWNPPLLWPVVLVIVLFILSLIPAAIIYRRRQNAKAL